MPLSIVYVLPFHHSIILFSVATAREQPSSAVAYNESCKYINIVYISYLVVVVFEMHITFRNHGFLVDLKNKADINILYKCYTNIIIAYIIKHLK